MYERILFVFDNLKVTFNPHDAPYHGFEMFAGDQECETLGTLYDLGGNAGYFPKGDTKIRGQVWYTDDESCVDELQEFAYPRSNVCQYRIRVKIAKGDGPLIVPATVFALCEVPEVPRRIESGYWPVKLQRGIR